MDNPSWSPGYCEIWQGLDPGSQVCILGPMPRPIGQYTPAPDRDPNLLLHSAAIASWIGANPQTVIRWRRQERFPKPDGRVPTPEAPYKDAPAWRVSTVLAWLRSTGRLVTMTPTSAPGAPQRGTPGTGPDDGNRPTPGAGLKGVGGWVSVA